jgi:hypothetical protein
MSSAPEQFEPELLTTMKQLHLRFKTLAELIGDHYGSMARTSNRLDVQSSDIEFKFLKDIVDID